MSVSLAWLVECGNGHCFSTVSGNAWLRASVRLLPSAWAPRLSPHCQGRPALRAPPRPWAVQPRGLPAGASEEPPGAHPESRGRQEPPDHLRGSQEGSPAWVPGELTCLAQLSGPWAGSVTCLGPGGESPVWVLGGEEVTCLGPGWAHLSGSLQCDSSVSFPIAGSSPSSL